MLTFSSLFSCVSLFVALMLPGFIMGKLGRIERSAVATLGNLISDIAMPALVFVKLIETDLTKLEPVTLIICIALPAAVILVMYFLIRAVFRKRGEGREHCSAIFCSVFSNCGFLGIPLAAALFPKAPEVTLYVSLANVVSSFIFLTLGMDILSDGGAEKKKRGMLRIIFRPVTVAVALGFICSAVGLGESFPSAVSYFGTLSQLTTPLSMTVLGFELSGMKIKSLFGDVRVYSVAAMKLLVAPLLCLSVLVLLKYALGMELSYYLSSGMFIATAVSTAASASAMARAHGIKGDLAASATLVNTLLCVVTLPLLWLLFDATLA